MLRARCASLTERQLLSAMCLLAINILLRWQNTSIMLNINMQFMFDEEKLQFLTWCPSGLTPWQIWYRLVCAKQVAECFFPDLDLVWCTYPIVL